MSNNTPFIFLEGSSGSGKSQMAFSIKANISNKRKTYYFHLNKITDKSQNIYKNFKNISDLFLKCLNADNEIIENADSPTCLSLYNKNLFLYGFIYEIISEENTSISVNIFKKTGLDIYELMTKMNLIKNRPVFIIDECIEISDNSYIKFRFIRNCFRALGLGLVLLGTDSRAASLPLSIGTSSRDEIPWCYIFGDFPSVDLSLLDLPSNTPLWFNSILQNSRPLFSHLVANVLQKEYTDFDTLLKTIFILLKDIKKIYQNYYGQLGQVRLFQNAHYALTNINDHISTPLIHSHFAQLVGNQKNIILLNSGSIQGQDIKWNPSSVFPKISDDILLYLILMGGKDFSAFYGTTNPVPYSKFFLEIKKNQHFRSQILDLSNAVEKINDGMFLETLLCSTISLASHSNGIKGVCLRDFLLNMVFQLQIDDIYPNQVSIEGLENIDMPFLSPPNQNWPTFLDIPDANFGNLSRSKNSEKIDLRAELGQDELLVGESKDYGNKLTIDKIRQILERVPEKAKLEIIFTRKLQNSYFNYPSESFNNSFKEKHLHLLRKSYFKINISSPKCILQSIKGLPNNGTEGIVIFMEINKEIRL